MYTLSTTIEDVGIGTVSPGMWQPRASFDPFKLAELAASIGEHGQIDPAIVWATPEEGRLLIVAGERRWRAACALRLAELYPDFTLEKWAELCASENPQDVPISEERAFSDWAGDAPFLARRVEAEDSAELFELALVDNLERDNLSTFEEATALRQLQSAKNYTQAVIAKRIGRSQAYVGQRLSLLKMEPAAIEIMAAAPGGIALSLARHVGRVKKSLQVEMATFVVASDISDRTTGAIVGLILKLSKLPVPPDFTDPFRESWGSRNWKSPASVAETLGRIWDNRTRHLDHSINYMPPRFPFDWNPRVDEDVTMREADKNILPDPAACEFCALTEGKELKRRCLLPACFDRKNALWAERDARLNPPPPEPERVAPAASVTADSWDTSSPTSPPATRPAPVPAPIEAKPLPVMTAIPAGPKAVTLTAVIQPGEILGERQVLISIGKDGQAPIMHRGEFADLVTLVEIALDEYFEPDVDRELAVAELETQEMVL